MSVNRTRIRAMRRMFATPLGLQELVERLVGESTLLGGADFHYEFRSSCRTDRMSKLAQSTSGGKPMKHAVSYLVNMLGLWCTAGNLPAQSWEAARIQGITLEYWVAGSGDAVVFIHGGLFADGLDPLARAVATKARHRVLNWHRVGYACSSQAADKTDIGSQAAQLVQLMRLQGMPRAHVVGHSSGGLIALQLALDHPELIRSLV